MDLDKVENFMREASRFLEESQPQRSTPKPRTSMPRPDDDDTLQKGPSDIDELRHLLHLQQLEMAEMRQQLSQTQARLIKFSWVPFLLWNMQVKVTLRTICHSLRPWLAHFTGVKRRRVQLSMAD